MEWRNFAVTIISATDLPNVREFGEMKVYAKISISGDSGTEQRTHIDTNGGTNPAWNCTSKYHIPVDVVRREDRTVVIKLYCDRTLGDRYVGEVNISLKKLFDLHEPGDRLWFTVQRSDSSDSYGRLDLSYSLGETFVVEKKSNSLAELGKAAAHVALHVGVHAVAIMLGVGH